MRRSKFNARVTITVPPERREQAMEVLRSLMGPIRAAEGCLGCSGCQDLEDSAWITLDSLWATEADLTSHIRSSDYLRILALMELSSQHPQVRFSTTSETAGMDLIERVRGLRPPSAG